MPTDVVRNAGLLYDPFLTIYADQLNTMEHDRIAVENQLNALTRTDPDKDGLVRGRGIPTDSALLIPLQEQREQLASMENEWVKTLSRQLRNHPLGPWVKAQKGVGDKQAARLLGVLGDPYWNDLHDRPRTVSELRAYCGLHNDENGLAVRRAKGQRSNWSTQAKMRAYLVAESTVKQLKATCKTEDGVQHVENCLCAPLRRLYDARKAETQGRLHQQPCVRCGPSGHPALAGTSWSDGHRHADALRVVSKELLKGLWIEARRLHEES